MNFLKKLFGFSIGPVLGMFVSLITIPITTYFINPTEYGKSAMFTLVQSVILAIAYLGLDQSFIVYYHEVKDKKKLLLNCIFTPLIIVVMIFCVLPFFDNYISSFLFGDSFYTFPVYLMVIGIPFIVIERFILLEIRMEEKAFQYSMYNVLLKIIIFLITLVYVLFIRQDFLAIVYSTILGQLIGDIILIIIYHRYLTFDISKIDLSLFKKMFKYALPLAITAIVSWGLNSVDKIFLRALSTFEEVGYYSLAMKLANFLGIIQTSFASFWTPTAFKWYNEKRKNKYFEIVSKTLACIMALIFLFILLLKNIIPILLSESYNQSVYIFPSLLLVPIMYTMSESTVYGIYFKKKSNIILGISVATILINILLNAILIPVYQAKGAAIATGISYLFFFWTRTLISRKLWYPIELNHFIFTSAILVFASIINSFIYDLFIITIINIICILLVICIYYKHIKYVIFTYLLKK